MGINICIPYGKKVSCYSIFSIEIYALWAKNNKFFFILRTLDLQKGKKKDNFETINKEN